MKVLALSELQSHTVMFSNFDNAARLAAHLVNRETVLNFKVTNEKEGAEGLQVVLPPRLQQWLLLFLLENLFHT